MPHIVHLDDHLLFTDGIRYILQEHFPDFLFSTFKDNESALIYISECFNKETKIDLIITDYNHLKGNGLEFAKSVRELEHEYSLRIPIMLLTMCDLDPTISSAVEAGIFDAYFHKSTEAAELLEFIRNNVSA